MMKTSSFAGLFLWVLFVVAKLITTPIDTLQYVMMLLLFAYLVLVPLTLNLVPQKNAFYRYGTRLQPFAAVCAGISFFFEQGLIAVLFAVPWLITTILIALYGFTRVIQEWKKSRIFDVLIQLGLMYISIGGVWLVLHRSGIQILNFSDVIVLLTSIHFHYAAFITPISMAFIGRMLVGTAPVLKPWFKLIAFFVIIGPPFIAAGITFGDTMPVLEFASVVEFVTPLVVFSILCLVYLIPKLDYAVKMLLSISFVSLLFSMSSAMIYGFAHINDTVILGIPLMVFFHGFVNTFGFSLFGLLGVTAFHEAKTSIQKSSLSM
ncbi:YndJ family protein [Alkalihalobacillus macyae]|uniref:YndJ family protein n=1 Tax=Guptibacillus hwajinpoensis TaxID=208199 RepID=UPI00273B58D6|nr:YndJ family protein [Alkalihalobacillus macyae]MDP4553444.1 YndJ family protein [Alkalihalobacillus macyae]